MMFQRKFTFLAVVLFALMSVFSGAMAQDTATPEAPQNWLYVAPQAGYQFEYPLDHYSVRQTDGGPTLNMLFPGIIMLQPNDSLIYRDGSGPILRITIAAWHAEDGAVLDNALFGTGPLMQYVPEMVRPDFIESIQVGGVDALRLHSLAVGMGGTGSDIFVLANDTFYEITLEEIADTDAGDVSGYDLVDSILSSFVFMTPEA